MIHRALPGCRHIAAVTTFAYANLILAPAAHAAGSSMPWEAPLQSILDSVEGPVAKIVAVIIIIVTGLTLATAGGDAGFSCPRIAATR
ncbi:conjugal transfer protein TrbC [Paracoccus mutanolyticus]|uniref:Conjugal transfer protein TrbC n=1 Tax=Paracoccus mutanolyticus TaxID=1499308 RepID=A0ABM6WRP0_9RHOB|nr:conjugal transfer protein TrbC [Paracoccus mutanolyticus]